MTSKIKTIVCGSTFGQFYIDALMKYSEFFEIAGLYARGSERSIELAKRYGIPLFTSIKGIPNEITLACVVIRSEGVGGDGCKLAIQLMERGIHVIQEQPVYPENVVECYKVARKYRVIYNIGNLYIKLPEQFEETWSKMLALWNGKLCSELGNEYLLNNIKKLSELFSGHVNPTHLLFPEGKFDYANALYKETFVFKFLNNLVLKSLKMVEQSNGKLEILELGAGTGSTTDAVLELIKENNKVTYFYTDISQFFLKEAQRRYADIDNILYSQLNIDDLNFDSKVDIIIANGVLNNAKHIDSTFEKMINLVRPGGKIFIIEQVAESLEILVSQVFMMEDIDNSTESETFRSVEEWKRIFNNDRIEKVEVYPDMHFIEQRLFIISCN